MTSKVSVIVPMYNVEAYIEECLVSLREQTDPDFEAICVDDASTDSTVAVAKACVQGDSRFRFLTMPHNSGLSATRNRGIDDATGTYLLFLDSDDYLDAAAVATLCAQADDQNLDVLDFTAESFYETRELRRTHNEDFNHRTGCDKTMSGPDLFVWFQKIDEFYCPAWLHLIRRSFLRDCGLRFEEGIIHEDELFSVQLLALAPVAAYLNRPLYKRRVRSGSIMTDERGMRNVDSFFKITHIMEDWLRAHADGYQPDFVDAYAKRIYNLRDLMARDAIFIDDDVLAKHADGLSLQDRIDFDLYVREHAKNVDKIYHEVTDTKTYKAGRAIMAFPSWVKSRVKMPS